MSDIFTKYENMKYDDAMKAHNEYMLDTSEYEGLRRHFEYLINEIVLHPKNTIDKYDLYDLTLKQLEDLEESLKSKQSGGRRKKVTKHKNSVKKSKTRKQRKSSKVGKQRKTFKKNKTRKQRKTVTHLEI